MKIAKIIKNGEDMPFDLNKLLTTRLLIQANAGGGKSYAIRKILEETHGKVQHIVLDLEGEFSSLREKYDYILVGKGKNVDVQIDIRGAELLAKKLLELKTSAIIDLYELKHHERILFVKRFLDSMVNAPKELWHPVLIFVDEAHQFCPESKAGKAESTASVIDLMTRGRKRGYCGILATQRISKLNKDAAADCNNKMIGRCSLDIDMKRAGDELGFTSKEDILKLREMNPGEFLCFGPAFTNKITKVKINKVKTTHPEAGQRIGFEPSSPTPKIKKMLSKLIGLPQKAEEELKEKGDYIKRIRNLEAQLRVQSKTNEKKEVIKVVNNIGEIRGLNFKIKDLEKRLIKTDNFFQIQKIKADGLEKQAKYGESIIKTVYPLLAKLIQVEKNIVEFLSKEKIQHILPPLIKKQDLIDKKIPKSKFEKEYSSPLIKEDQHKALMNDSDFEAAPLNKCAKLIYGFLFANSDRAFTKVQIAVMTGYSVRSGGFQSAMASLNTKELILKEDNLIRVNPNNLDPELSDEQEEFSLDLIKKKLNKCSRELLEVLIEDPSKDYSKEELAEVSPSQYSYTSGGFQSALAKLNTLGFIEKTGSRIKLSKYIEELI